MKHMIPKKGKAEFELYPGYGLTQIKATAVGFIVGIILVVIITTIQSYLPLKEVPYSSINIGMSYVESSKEGYVFVSPVMRKTGPTAIIIYCLMGAIFTLPVIEFGGESLKYKLKRMKKYQKIQKVYFYEKVYLGRKR